LITEEELNALVGTPFPGGTYTAEPYVNWLTCDCVLAPELSASGAAHPLLFYLAAQAGIGLSLTELFALCRGSSEDGPMLGEWGMEVNRPVQVGADYAVVGGITGVVRKTGRKTGVFDIVRFELQLRSTADSAEPDAIVHSSFIYPRRG
jgi:hypothetical protein